MDWTDDGIVLSARRFGESALIVEILTRKYGRTLGLLRRGGAGRTGAVAQAGAQAGNKVQAVWRGRLDEHLGQWTLELQKAYAVELMDDPLALAGLTAACASCRALPEREVHEKLYEGLGVLCTLMNDSDFKHLWPVGFIHWELGLLKELGFGLDLSRCAASGRQDDLIYVSPRSGRAVSRKAGAPYAERLLPLPSFLLQAEDISSSLASLEASPPDMVDVLAGLQLTGYFLEAHVFAHDDLPASRGRLISALERRSKVIDRYI
ncbi:MAG: DNA repair protein RecO [Parvularculales bacterium]